MSAISRIKIVHDRNKDEFYGQYKDHEINVERQHDGRFYILVKNDVGYLYDGWMKASDADTTIEAAVEDAMIGSGLIEDNPND